MNRNKTLEWYEGQDVVVVQPEVLIEQSGNVIHRGADWWIRGQLVKGDRAGRWMVKREGAIVHFWADGVVRILPGKEEGAPVFIGLG